MAGVKLSYVVALLGACVGTGLLLLLQNANDAPRPSFTRIKVEPAEVLNRQGADRWLLTFCVSNVNTGSFAPEKYLFFSRKSTGSVECRKSGLWIKDEEAFVTPFVYSLRPGETWIGLVLVPPGTECCRVPVTYTGGMLTMRSRIGGFTERLPLPIRSLFRGGFWRWAGFRQPIPSKSWREATFDFDVTGVWPGTPLVQ
jgi:hypothetical protein